MKSTPKKPKKPSLYGHGRGKGLIRDRIYAAMQAEPGRTWTTKELAAVGFCSRLTAGQISNDLVAEGLIEDTSEHGFRELALRTDTDTDDSDTQV